METRTVTGRYRLLRRLGSGGMGTVWLAHDELLDRNVAIKEIRLPFAGEDDPAVKRALREAQAAARLNHPGIITVHDVVVDDHRPWIVMELVEGGSLAGAIRDHGLLTEQRTAEIGLAVLDALHAAHRGGITHRDVKPANILLDSSSDRVVLTDFGIAAIDDATALTRTGQMVGSPAYIAPERLNGRPATAASDLWALGVTLYAAVTGESPFHRDYAPATLAAILTSKPVPPAHAGRLWPVIKELLHKDPEKRLTAERARPLLAAVASPGPARPVPPRPRRSRFDDLTRTALGAPATPRRRWPVAIAALLVLAAVAIVVVVRSGVSDRSGASDDGTTTRPTTSPTPPVVYHGALSGHSDTVLALAFSPDGRTLVTGGSDRTVRIWDTGAGRPVEVRTQPNDVVLDLAFSPDGTMLASAGHTDDPTIRLWATDGWKPLGTLNVGVTSVQALAFSPDGRTLAAGGLSGRIVLFDTRTLTERKRLAGHTGGTYDLAFNPAGTLLASGGSDGRARVWDAATGRPVAELPGPPSMLAVAFGHGGTLLAAGGSDGEARLWNTATWRPGQRLATADAQIETLDFSPDDGWLIAGTESDLGVPVWQVRTGRITREVNINDEWPMIARFSPDGRTIATGGADQLVRLAGATDFIGP